MLKLTDYETGGIINVKREEIKSARQLPAEVVSDPIYGDVPQELGRRTRIDTATDIFLVRETVEEVMGDPSETLQRGTMVFWDARQRPYWVIEWQSENGDGCYWIVDGEGNHATAPEDELSVTPQSGKMIEPRP